MPSKYTIDDEGNPHNPTAKQWAAHAMQHTREVFYGGAGGGGKTDWLLREALMYVDVPTYSAILFRESFPNLSHEPDGLIPRLAEWLRGTDARFAASTRTWHFPAGSTISFGYLYKADDHLRYAGPSYQFIGYDEATEIRSRSYQFLFSRLRRGTGQKIPLRVRAASNPGGRSHAFFRDRFHLDQPRATRNALLPPSRRYVPAFIQDNPYLDQESYIEALGELTPVDRERLMHGDWSVNESGDVFKWEWFPIVGDYPRDARLVRSWDLAATEKTQENPDPDWTVGMLLAEKGGQVWVVDVIRVRQTAFHVDKLMAATAARDGQETQIFVEQEPGSAGKRTVADIRRTVLPGYTVRSNPSSGSKAERARPVSSAAEAGNVILVRGPWVEPFLEEVTMFKSDNSGGGHDDQVDALSGGYTALMGHSEWWVA